MVINRFSSLRRALFRALPVGGLTLALGAVGTPAAVANDAGTDAGTAERSSGHDHGPRKTLHPTGRQVVARTARPTTVYQLPFACGQVWVGSTRSYHSPSVNAVDFNRSDDFRQPVVAAAAGTIEAVRHQDLGGYGKYIVVDHGGGESTLYAHLDSVFGKEGAYIDQGTLVGRLGTTGNSTGPHLHFEQRIGSTVVEPWVGGGRLPMGTSVTSRNCAETPFAGNLKGDRTTELVMNRRTTGLWKLLDQSVGPERMHRLGTRETEPVFGDWDGDGTMEAGMRLAGGRFILSHPGRFKRIRFGAAADHPVVGDWDGNGVWDVGVRRAGHSRFVLRNGNGSTRAIALGEPDDLPVTGDWNGDGTTDVGVFDPETGLWTLRFQRDTGAVVITKLLFGQTPGDLPVVGDWDGNGYADIGIWRARDGVFHLRHGAHIKAARDGVRRIEFGNRRR